MGEQITEGWGLPGRSKKWHYFNGSFSLCKKWGFYFGSKELGNDDSEDNCKQCQKLLKKRQETKGEPPCNG